MWCGWILELVGHPLITLLVGYPFPPQMIHTHIAGADWLLFKAYIKPDLRIEARVGLYFFSAVFRGTWLSLAIVRYKVGMIAGGSPHRIAERRNRLI